MPTLAELNQAAPAEFLRLIGGPLEGQTWLAERVVSQRPFASVDALSRAFAAAATAASETEQIALIASHPDLGEKLAIKPLSDHSEREQAAAGLDQLTPAEYALFHQSNQVYRAAFGFPFVICAREHTRDSILAAFAERQHHTRAQELATALAEVLKILRLRLADSIHSAG